MRRGARWRRWRLRRGLARRAGRSGRTARAAVSAIGGTRRWRAMRPRSCRSATWAAAERREPERRDALRGGLACCPTSTTSPSSLSRDHRLCCWQHRPCSDRDRELRVAPWQLVRRREIIYQASAVPPQAGPDSIALFAIARASSRDPAARSRLPNNLMPVQTTASVLPGRLGAIRSRDVHAPSERTRPRAGGFLHRARNRLGASMSLGARDRCPTTPRGTSIRRDPALAIWLSGPPRTVVACGRTRSLLDDVLGDQFIYSGPSQTSAPSPAGQRSSSADHSVLRAG